MQNVKNCYESVKFTCPIENAQFGTEWAINLIAII